MLLSKNEDLVCRELKKHGFAVFRIKDIRLLLHLNRTKSYNIMKALKGKKIIKKVNGYFAFTNIDNFVLGCITHYPSYVSFWSALNYYGWSDQNPIKVFLATTKYGKNTGSFQYVTLGKKRFFGYDKIGEFAIADKEKAIIDSLLFPKYSGGMLEIKVCLEKALKELNIEKLLSYAVEIGSMAVIRRLGFLLEHLKYKNIDKFKKYVGTGYERLDPSLHRKNMLNKKWLLDINW